MKPDTQERPELPPNVKHAHKKIEQEANVFALMLLIPSQFLIPELEKGLNLADDTDFDNLCKKFDVTSTMMLARLSLLRKTNPNAFKYGRK